MRKKVYSENHWSDLASQLGIDNSNTPDSQTTTDVEIAEEISVQDQSPPLTDRNQSSDMIKETAFYPEPDSFGKGLMENQDAVAEEVPPPTKKLDGKKRFFERFPKINLLGTVVKESLEAVVEGVKSPSLSGKMFTSNRLEKIPTVSDYTARDEVAQEKIKVAPEESAHNEKTTDRFDKEKVFSDVEEAHEEIICTEEHTKAIVDIFNPWSKIVSQVDVLTVLPSQLNQDESDLSEWLETAATADTDKNSEQTEKNSEQSAHSSRDFNKRAKYHNKRHSRKSLPSMFDEPTPESEESVALKNLMESEQYDNDAEKRLRSIFSEEEKAEWTTANELTPRNQYSNDSTKQRGKYYGNIDNYSENQTKTFSPRSDREEESFTVNEEHFDRVEAVPRELVRERGRRGARFEPREAKQEHFNAKNNTEENRLDFVSRSENIGTTWDIEEESKPVERFPHKHRRGRNLENNTSSREFRTLPEEPISAVETKPTTEEEMEMIQLHKNIPSWDEAIEQLIEHNIARRFQSSTPRNGGGRR
jgi:hypothetical protein